MEPEEYCETCNAATPKILIPKTSDSDKEECTNCGKTEWVDLGCNGHKGTVLQYNPLHAKHGVKPYQVEFDTPEPFLIGLETTSTWLEKKNLCPPRPGFKDNNANSLKRRLANSRSEQQLAWKPEFPQAGTPSTSDYHRAAIARWGRRLKYAREIQDTVKEGIAYEMRLRHRSLLSTCLFKEHHNRSLASIPGTCDEVPQKQTSNPSGVQLPECHREFRQNLRKIRGALP